MNDQINNNGIEANQGLPLTDVADDFLEALFAKAANTQPELEGDNFTKIVVNSIPSRLNRSSVAGKLKRFLPDSIGLIVGVFVMSFFVNPSQLLSSFSGVSLDSQGLAAITFNPATFAGFALIICGLSVAAFISVDRNR